MRAALAVAHGLPWGGLLLFREEVFAPSRRSGPKRNLGSMEVRMLQPFPVRWISSLGALHGEPFTGSPSLGALHGEPFTGSPSRGALHGEPFTGSPSRGAL